MLPLVLVRRLLFLFILLSIGIYANAQDSLVIATDTMAQVDTYGSERVASPPSTLSKKLGNVRTSTSGMTPFFIGLAAFLLFGLLRFLYAKHLDALVNVLSKSTLGRMNSKDSLWHNLMPRWLFVALYFICSGYLIGRFIQYFTTLRESEITFWFWGMGIIIGLSVLKRLSVLAVSLVFRFAKTANAFFNHLSVVNQLLGFILLPICGALLLAPAKFGAILLFIGGFIFVISLIFKLLINVSYVRNLPRVSFFHFILYLCTLEIIPLAICARYVHNSIGA